MNNLDARSLIKMCTAHISNFPNILKDLNFYCIEKNIIKLPLQLTDDEDISIQNIELIYKDFFQQYIQHQPLDYILKSSKFYGLDIYVNQNVLIPRPETEILVDCVSNMNLDPRAIVDAGCGSGCISIALSILFPQSLIISIDRSIQALKVTKINCNKHKCQNIKIFHGDWLDAIRPNSIDLIVSNPPYIKRNDTHLEHLQGEPQDALIAGSNGLESYQKLLSQSEIKLKPGGLLALEHGYNQKESLLTLTRKYNFKVIKALKDFQKLDRVIILEKSD